MRLRLGLSRPRLGIALAACLCAPAQAESIAFSDGTERISVDTLDLDRFSEDRPGEFGFCLPRADGEAFARMTERNVGRTVAIEFRGAVVTAPLVRVPITGGCVVIAQALNRPASDLLLHLREINPRARDVARCALDRAARALLRSGAVGFPLPVPFEPCD